jgi:hypothetical protein
LPRTDRDQLGPSGSGSCWPLLDALEWLQRWRPDQLSGWRLGRGGQGNNMPNGLSCWPGCRRMPDLLLAGLLPGGKDRLPNYLNRL